MHEHPEAGCVFVDHSSGRGVVQFPYGANGDRFKELATSNSTWFDQRGFERSVASGQQTDRHELGPIVVDRVAGVDTVKCAHIP